MQNNTKYLFYQPSSAKLPCVCYEPYCSPTILVVVVLMYTPKRIHSFTSHRLDHLHASLIVSMRSLVHSVVTVSRDHIGHKYFGPCVHFLQTVNLTLMYTLCGLLPHFDNFKCATSIFTARSKKFELLYITIL